jgi:hypothetical protein
MVCSPNTCGKQTCEQQRCACLHHTDTQRQPAVQVVKPSIRFGAPHVREAYHALLPLPSPISCVSWYTCAQRYVSQRTQMALTQMQQPFASSVLCHQAQRRVESCYHSKLGALYRGRYAATQATPGQVQCRTCSSRLNGFGTDSGVARGDIVCSSKCPAAVQPPSAHDTVDIEGTRRGAVRAAIGSDSTSATEAGPDDVGER